MSEIKEGKLIDSAGVEFDPDYHDVKPDGTPKRTIHGKFRKKRVQGPKTPSETSQPPIEPKQFGAPSAKSNFFNQISGFSDTEPTDQRENEFKDTEPVKSEFSGDDFSNSHDNEQQDTPRDAEAGQSTDESEIPSGKKFVVSAALVLFLMDLFFPIIFKKLISMFWFDLKKIDSRLMKLSEEDKEIALPATEAYIEEVFPKQLTAAQNFWFTMVSLYGAKIMALVMVANGGGFKWQEAEIIKEDKE